MRKFKKWMFASGLFTLVIVLSGCVSTVKKGANAGQPTGEGWVYNLLVKPMGNAITFLVNNFDWSYGFAIIAMTIIVRLIIMPLGLYQAKKSMVQTEKMAALKPQLDAIQAKTKAATTREEQMAAQMETQALYKENGMSMFGGMGCLPLLIQMPIFTALFYSTRYTDGISDSVFFGIPLGKPSIIFVILAGLIYLAQGYVSMIGMPEAQKKQMRTMTFMSPLMIVFISYSSPAGVSLYWVVSGLFGCIQSLITNLYHKPKIKAAIAEELRKNPPKTVVTPVVSKAKDITNDAQVTNTKNRNNQGNARNTRNNRQK